MDFDLHCFDTSATEVKINEELGVCHELCFFCETNIVMQYICVLLHIFDLSGDVSTK